MLPCIMGIMIDKPISSRYRGWNPLVGRPTKDFTWGFGIEEDGKGIVWWVRKTNDG